MLENLTSTDLAKDSLLAALGFMPSALTQAQVELILGLLNILIVVLFRVIELKRRNRRDDEIERLQTRINELTDQTGK